MAVGAWLKNQEWYPNTLIPLAIVFMAVAFNVGNAYLFGGDFLEAGKLAIIEAIGNHSGLKNSLEESK
ncbi:hypothetical protein EEL32_24825 [Brevibacillus laterosporus]|nr:hypothetical protein [Brevibacillus laterosporus]TPG74796.1 hypothetical protein EEL32_24825 [Brevibacillus laterosporus]